MSSKFHFIAVVLAVINNEMHVLCNKYCDLP
jgi:hypothetical protein